MVTFRVLLKLKTVSPSMALLLALSILRRLLMTCSVPQHPEYLLMNGSLRCRTHVAPRLYIMSLTLREFDVIVVLIRLTSACATL